MFLNSRSISCKRNFELKCVSAGCRAVPGMSPADFREAVYYTYMTTQPWGMKLIKRDSEEDDSNMSDDEVTYAMLCTPACIRPNVLASLQNRDYRHPQVCAAKLTTAYAAPAVPGLQAVPTVPGGQAVSTEPAAHALPAASCCACHACCASCAECNLTCCAVCALSHMK